MENCRFRFFSPVNNKNGLSLLGKIKNIFFYKFAVEPKFFSKLNLTFVNHRNLTILKVVHNFTDLHLQIAF